MKIDHFRKFPELQYMNRTESELSGCAPFLYISCASIPVCSKCVASNHGNSPKLERKSSARELPVTRQFLVNERRTAEPSRPTNNVAWTTNVVHGRNTCREPSPVSIQLTFSNMAILRYPPWRAGQPISTSWLPKKAIKWFMHGILGGKLVHFLLHITAVHDPVIRLIQNLGRRRIESG